MKKTNGIRAALCAVTACAVVTGAAFALGAGDGLISLDHLQTVFIPAAVSQGNKAADKLLQATYDAATRSLDKVDAALRAQLTGEDGGLYSQAIAPHSFGQGDTVTLGEGATLLVTAGAVRATHDGVLIDATAGTEIPSGARLTAAHRYIVGEGTHLQATVLSGSGTMGYGGGYSFTAGAGKSHPFTDVTTDDAYNDAVTYVYENGLFAGMGDGTFGVKAAMDRAMVMTVFYHLAGDPTGQLDAATAAFTDVPKSAWYAPFVSWGFDQKVTAGTGTGLFSPTAPVNQQQMVMLLYNFATNYLRLDLTGRADLTGVAGADQTADWARDAMSWALAKKIVSAPLAPTSSSSRADVAVMLSAFAAVYLD